jgi:general L-amino acid transport system permease protein
MTTQTSPATLALEDQAPIERSTPVQWMHTNLFSSVWQTMLTLLVTTVVLHFGWRFFDWAVLRAVWVSPDPAGCNVAGVGACWAVIVEKHRPMLFGLYPYAEHWRMVLFIAIYLGTLIVSLTPAFWNMRFLVPLWIVAFLTLCTLIWGGVFGLRYVPTSEWGGLPLTIIMFSGTVLFGLPVAVLLALGRRSPLPVARGVSVVFIESLRGVPLITILFVAVSIFPLFLPPGVEVNKLLRVTIGVAIFFACYQAEVIRGGLQAVPRGQYEAADSLNLTYWQTTRRIILPQAIRIALPAITNHIIAAMKNTSFVIIIGLFDILTATTAVMADPLWSRFYIEAYMFVAFIYFIFGYALSLYARQVEKWTATGQN